jgi:3-oxoacyl-[acyl-carrier protein] reductase
MPKPGLSAPFSLQGRVALVTGAASGIGAATAALLAQAGADVVCGWYEGDPHDVSTTVSAIRDQGRKALTVEANLADGDSGDRLVGAALEHFGRIDIVLANAGIARITPFTEVSDADWQRVFDVNLGGVVRCFRAALPHMLRQGTGRLLATSSTSGALQGWPDHVSYTASKAGIVGLVRALAVEVGSSGVTVNAVAPGVIETPQSADPVNSIGPDGLRSYGRLVPLGRIGNPDEIGWTFVFLASDAASYITGQTIVVDGGASLFDGTTELRVSSRRSPGDSADDRT